jgi:hypothetical protein
MNMQAAKRAAQGRDEQGSGRKLSMADLKALKSAKDLDLDTHISLKHKYVYIMVSKAASSTVTYHLQYAEFLGSKFSVKNVNSRYNSPHIAPFQLTSSKFLAILRNDDFRKVTVVRNPYARLLSCYLHRVIGTPNANPTKKALKRRLGGTKVTDLSFEQFIDRICHQKNAQMERHYALQHDVAMYPLINYAFIGKVETLHDDLLKMEDLLFGKEVFDRKALATENRAPMQTGSNTKIRQYYTDALAAKVAERYALDFETFGYSTDLDAV